MLGNTDYEKMFGDGFEPVKTPETIAYGASLDFSAQVILEARRQGVSLTELAERMGTSLPNLSKKLNGKSNLTLKSMVEIALALGCELESPRIVPSMRFGAETSLISGHEAEWVDNGDRRVYGSADLTVPNSTVNI